MNEWSKNIWISHLHTEWVIYTLQHTATHCNTLQHEWVIYTHESVIYTHEWVMYTHAWVIACTYTHLKTVDVGGAVLRGPQSINESFTYIHTWMSQVTPTHLRSGNVEGSPVSRGHQSIYSSYTHMNDSCHTYEWVRYPHIFKDFRSWRCGLAWTSGYNRVMLHI